MTSEDQDFVLLGDKDLADFNAHGLLPQSLEDINKIRKWLDPTDYASDSSEYNKHKTSYTAGTGKWIRETEQYQQWMTSPEHGSLWIKGVAGSGKSVVAAHLASLLEDTKVPILHFFFRQIIAANRTPQSLVRDWLSQLLDFSPMLQLKLKGFVKEERNLDTVSFDDLWELVVSALSEIPRAYCVADALDEMDFGNEPFMRELAFLGQKYPSKVKVLMTSRPLPYIERALAHTEAIQLVLRPQLINHDILTYLKTKLNATDLPEDCKAEIEQGVGSRSRGLFLYARLMLDEILASGKSDLQSICDFLDKLPSGLGDMYTRMLHEHSNRSETPQDLQLLILQCVTHSSRPLRLLELSTVADFVRKTSHYRIFSPPMGLTKDTKSIIRNGCGPLLEVLEDETVSIIHHSFTEYLINPERRKSSPNGHQFPHVDLSETHLAIAKLCVNYLLSDWPPNWNENDDETDNLSSARLKHPFLDYALNNWHHHVSKYGDIDQELFQVLDRLLEPNSKALSSCRRFMRLDICKEEVNSRSKRTSPLHICALKGLTAYAAHLVKLGQDVNSLDPESRTPLHRAAEKGNHGVVEVLLRNGAANNMDDFAGLTPLHLAASANHAAVMKLLLVAGVDPFTPKTREHPGRRCGNSKRTRGETAVEYASVYGHTAALHEFLPFLDGDGLNKALGWSARNGRTQNVLAILDTPEVDINGRFEGNTPIQGAAHSHDIVSTKKLLELGADVSIKSSNSFGGYGMRYVDFDKHYDYTPLHAFAQNCRGKLKNSLTDTIEGIRLLLGAGCDINEYSGGGFTALHYAISSSTGYLDSSNFCPTEIIAFLLENGADISLCVKDHNRATVLHLAATELESTIDLLVAKGADVNARRAKDGRTPLLCSINPYNDKTALALLKHGADCNAQDYQGTSALQIALENHSPSLTQVKALLANGADPNFRNKKGETALHVMRSWARQGDLLESLLAAKADLEAKTSDGLTVLLRAVKNNNSHADIKDLINAGARTDARDFDGRTVLHYCCEKENSIELLGTLIDMGADPSLRDFAGNTLFHQIARQQPSYHEKAQLELLTTLVQLGVSPTSTNNAGQTPFHIAAGMGRATTRHVSYKTDPFKFLLGPKCNADINASDNKGVRPIHLAATLGEAQVKELLDLGADPMVLTMDGQSVLHIASRNRESNTVGMMVELYNTFAQTQVSEVGVDQLDGLGRSPLIDLPDQDGRTALHYAARSGRLESVAILLEMGKANPNIKDGKGLSPLDMCVQFREENNRWQGRGIAYNSKSYINAASVTLDDIPHCFENAKLNLGSDFTSENQTVGIRQIIRLLIQNGADIPIMRAKDLRRSSGGHNLLKSAIDADCEVVVDELLHMAELNPMEKNSHAKGVSAFADTDDSDEEDDGPWRYHSPWKSFAEKYVALRYQDPTKHLEGIVEPGKPNFETFRTLLQTENGRGIEALQRFGADILKPQWNGESCMTILVKWGYASFLSRFRSEASLVTADWMVETEKTDCNLPGRLRFLLHIACARALPNLHVLRALPLHDINSQDKKDGRTALHILAPTSHWWQSHAMVYLLEQGANPNLKDFDGKTPLHLAVNGIWKDTAVGILLQHGADPNILDNDGLTCLNLAGSNASIIRTLINAGANVSVGKKPFVFDAIAALDLETVKLLREMGSDFNVRPAPEESEEEGNADSDDEDVGFFQYQMRLFNSKTTEEMSYPIHYAASSNFNNSKSKEKMIPIIKELLSGRANPFLPFNDDSDSILHDLFENEGIVEPFIEIPDLNLEARDSMGKTYLLAACSTADDYWRNHDMAWLVAQPSSAQLLLAKGADISAVDNEGRNAFHHLLRSASRYKTLRASHPTDLKHFLAHPQAASLVLQKDAKGETPLHHAVRNCQLWAVDLLLDSGADPLEADPDGNTALHHLASQFSAPSSYSDPSPLTGPLFDKFLSLGISINTVNCAGETPIFRLISSSGLCLKHLQMFESKCADLSVKDNLGRGLLHAVAKHKSAVEKDGVVGMEVQIFRYLMEKGLDPMLEDGEQRSSLDVAMASGSVGILEIFKRDK